MALKLSNIKIQNYKSINEVELEIKKYDKSYTTIFVGKNETGKSNLLDAIAFINKPNNEFNYEELKNAQNEEDEYIDFYFTYKFSNDNEWKQLLRSNLKAPAEIIEKINIHALERNVYLHNDKSTFSSTTNVKYDKLLDNVLSKYTYSKISSSDENNQCLYEISLLKTVDTNNNTEINKLSSSKLSEILRDIFSPVININIPTVSKWKYSQEYLITETINLNEFKDNTNICYPLKNIFNLAGYSTKEEITNKINTLSGSPKNINKLEKILENTATEYINKVWAESKIKFKVKIQNDLRLAVYVIDEADDENTYYMTDRSEGFKQFVSLILSISAANETDSLKNNIILIDEPEVHMHPSGIRFMRNELLRIGENNYVFLATHSQFMVDNNNRERHYIVTKPENNTCVKVWNSTIDLADDEVLRQAFGINVLNDLLAKHKMLVEGYSDYQIISKALNILVPNNCITITNGTGSNVVTVASMLKMYNVPVFTLVDSDIAGEKYKKDIIKLGNPFNDNSVKTLRDLNDEVINYGTIEDTLDSKFVIKNLKLAYMELMENKNCDFEYSETKPILEEFKICMNKEKINKDRVEKIIESGKCKIATEFNPTITNLKNKHQKLLEILNKIINYFGG